MITLFLSNVTCVKMSEALRESWYENGVIHRIEGPARIYSDGVEVWFFQGALHRSDGPAVEWDSPSPQEGLSNRWYINGLQVTPEQ